MPNRVFACKRETTRPAFEQGNPEFVLEQFDLCTCGRLRQVQLLGSLGQTATLNNRSKCA